MPRAAPPCHNIAATALLDGAPAKNLREGEARPT